MVLSILITHYNRSKALKECIDSFKKLNLNISHEFVISDDCSDASHLSELEKIENIKLVRSNINLGLGMSINNGLKNCSGKFILYCQEDFFVKTDLSILIHEIIYLLENNVIDMVRLTANYRFPKLKYINENISRIPKLSVRNFFYNAFQYSDNPFVVKNDFYVTNGFYLENVKGTYCELEYSIRIMKSNVRIAILNQYVFTTGIYESVLNYNPNIKTKTKAKTKRLLHKTGRALRLHIEYLFYNPNKRKLLTYKRTSHYISNKKNK